MTIRRLINLVSALESLPHLSPLDLGFIEEIKAYCESAEADRKTKSYAQAAADQDKKNFELDKQFIFDLYAKRWLSVKGSNKEYTCNDSPENKIWISFSHACAEIFNCTYLEILFSSPKHTVNSLDPNSLQPLSKYKNPTGFYFGSDNQTLYHVNGVLQRLDRGKFSTTRPDKILSEAPFSILELHRLREKRGGNFCFSKGDYKYDGLWSWIRSEFLPHCPNSNGIRREMVYDLFELVDSFFQNKTGLDHFKKEVLQYCRTLQEFTHQEVNALYGLAIEVEEQTDYLVEILLDCLSDDAKTLHSKMLAVQSWLHRYDASLVVGHDKPLSSKEVISHCLTLETTSSAAISEEIKSIRLAIEANGGLTDAYVKSLRTVFEQRWNAVKGSELDYTHSQSAPNDEWILLAQKLAGSGLVSSNYYQLLMPSITHGVNPITQDRICRFSLDECVVSEDGQTLIHLPQCVKHLQSKGTFYVPGKPPRPLTEQERNLIRVYRPAYIKYLKSYNQHVAALSLSTVLAVKKLVDMSLYPIGLLYLHDYSDEQLTSAEMALDGFFKSFYSRLSEDEKKRLDDHPIILNGEKKTFSMVMDEIKSGKCIALSCQWFAQLVVDYLPWVSFREDIEKKAHIDEMRDTSKQYAVRVDGYLLHQLQCIYFSLLNRKFSAAIDKISAHGMSNRVPDGIGRELFNLLTPIFSEKTHEPNLQMYSQIMYAVKEALANSSWSGLFTGHKDTKVWLQSILDNTLVTNTPWFQPAELFVALSQIHSKEVRLPDGLFKSLLRAPDSMGTALKINAIFVELRQKQPLALINQIIEKYLALIEQRQSSFQLLGNHLVECLKDELQPRHPHLSGIRFFSGSSSNGRAFLNWREHASSFSELATYCLNHTTPSQKTSAENFLRSLDLVPQDVKAFAVPTA